MAITRIKSSIIKDGTIIAEDLDSTFLAELLGSPEIYGFSVNATGNLIVTTTNGGTDNITSSTYDTFSDVIIASTGFTWSLVGTQLRCTI
jgi:hypothetical protein